VHAHIWKSVKNSELYLSPPPSLSTRKFVVPLGNLPPRLSVCHDGVIWFSRHFTFVSLYQFFFLLSLVSPHVFSSVCVLTKRKENLLPFCIHGERPSYEYPASVFFLVRSWEKTESARLHVRCLAWMSTTSITLALIFPCVPGNKSSGITSSGGWNDRCLIALSTSY
jgi:hypothetical protein